MRLRRRSHWLAPRQCEEAIFQTWALKGIHVRCPVNVLAGERVGERERERGGRKSDRERER